MQFLSYQISTAELDAVYTKFEIYALLISAIGLFICRHETFGVCTQEESQSLWHAGRIWRRVRAALLGTMTVCFLIYLWRW